MDRLLTPRILRPYIPVTPTLKQRLFLCLPKWGYTEALYGGAAGGGKSEVLLMAALQYVDVPGYAALILRRSYQDLSKAGALIDRAHSWLAPTDARWNEQKKTWTFPSSARLEFGYLEHERDIEHYQSAEYQFVGPDELTQFSLRQYRYVAFSRVRRLAGSTVPLRRMSASNPGGRGHEWVKQRFLIAGRREGRFFVPARLDDNQHLDREEYIRGLSHLDPITRAQLLNGDWSARSTGGKFKREWFDGRYVDAAPRGATVVIVRRWDLAATELSPELAEVEEESGMIATGPAFTAGVKISRDGDGVYYVEDVRQTRQTPQGVKKFIGRTSQEDGLATIVRMEQEPGASGKAVIDDYRRHVLANRDFAGVPSTGSKQIRANPFSSACEAGDVRIVRGPWVSMFLDQLEAFPNGDYDDMVDASGGAYLDLANFPLSILPIAGEKLEEGEGPEFAGAMKKEW